MKQIDECSPNQKNIILVGHRGANYKDFNQNTIRVFQQVIDEGTDEIEIDIHLSKDKEIFTFHDVSLDKTSNGQGPIAEKNKTEISKFYVGDTNNFVDRIPTLKEVLDLLSAQPEHKRPRLQIELKGTQTGLPASELVKQYVSQDKLNYRDILFISFSRNELVAVRATDKQFAIGILAGHLVRSELEDKFSSLEEFAPYFFRDSDQNYILLKHFSSEINGKLLDHHIHDHTQRAQLKAILDNIISGQCYDDELFSFAQEINAYSINLYYKTISEKIVSRAHSEGLIVYAYTVNESDSLKEILSFGVDGIVTDYPKKIEKLLEDKTTKTRQH